MKPRMEALVSGSLPPDERAMAEQHIAMCEGCRLELELVRAIGSQEKPPAASGSKDDWTLDRIFGSDAAGGGPAPSASPAETPPQQAPAPEPVLETQPPTASPEPAPPAEEAAPSERPGRVPVEASWSFEPADAAAPVKPPEQSLFFAAEALNRSRGAEGRKASNARVILWSMGGLLGVGLLGFSAWFVLHRKPSSAEDATSRFHAVPAPQGKATPAPAPATQPSPAPEPAPSPADGTIQDDSGEAPNSAVEAPAPTPPPAPAPARVTASAAPAPQTMPLATRAEDAAPKKMAHAAAKPVAAPKPPAPKPAPAEPRVTRAEPSNAAPAPTAPKPRETTDDTIVTPEDDGSSDAETPESASSTTSDDGETPAPSRPATRGSSMWESHTAKPSEPPADAAPQAPATPEISTPLDRLHLATVAAEDRGDVDALRRMRTTWKSYTLKIVGPERARAKREYADCLWAIQSATGRRADQKDALAAYRDYLLGAPAGGADSRSVSRLRQLEDALAEQR